MLFWGGVNKLGGGGGGGHHSGVRVQKAAVPRLFFSL